MTFKVALCIVIGFSALAQTSKAPDALLDRLTGKWEMQGIIAKKNTTHDITAEWVLGQQYLRIQEVSREKNAANQPAYEAIILIAWDPKLDEYNCLWLDNTGPWDFTAQGIGHGKRSADAITFRFGSNDGSSIKTTFAYNKAVGGWQWTIDNESAGKSQPFARLKLTRK